MHFVLAMCGGIIGMLVTGAAVFTVWGAIEAGRQERGVKGNSARMASLAADALKRWTVMDYAALFVFMIGAMLLLSDLIAVHRDRASYPYYHYGYLFSAFIFMLVGMLVTVLRLGLLLRRPSLQDKHEKPGQTD